MIVRKKQGIDFGADDTAFPVTVRQKVSNCISVFISGPVESPQDFIYAIDTMGHAEVGDEVVVHLSSGGGCISSGDSFLFAMRRCQEKGIPVHVIASGLIASWATWVLMEASSFELSSGAHFLIHAGSMANGGALNEFKAATEFNLKYMEKQIRDVYQYFLTEEEIDSMFKGVDLWMDVEEFVQRYETRNKLIQEAMEQQQEEEMTEQDFEEMSIEELEALGDQVNERLMELYEEKDNCENGCPSCECKD